MAVLLTDGWFNKASCFINRVIHFQLIKSFVKAVGFNKGCYFLPVKVSKKLLEQVAKRVVLFRSFPLPAFSSYVSVRLRVRPSKIIQK